MWELCIESCSPGDIDALTDHLEASGALAVSMLDRHDDPILEPKPGETPLWNELVVQALYDDEHQASDAQQQLRIQYPSLMHTLKQLPEQDWERVCLDQFKPILFGTRLWVCPSWFTPPEPEQVNLILDPGLAFGTGSHPTTSLCLTWLDQATLIDKDIIDYGCGSGILALAALKLGARHTYAIDIDDQALLATQQNATRNDIPQAALTIGQPDIMDASIQVDIIIANILLSPLLTLQNTFQRHLRSGGYLVISGVFATQVPTLIDAYRTHFTHHHTLIQGDWALIIFQN